MSAGKNQSAGPSHADVVIIGGGGSGLPAAVSAVEAGAKKVVVLDKRKMLGGTGRLPGGLFAVESAAQKRLGIHITADECFTDHMERANWTCDARLARNWINGSKDIVRWLEEKGIYFNDVIAFTGTNRLYHQVANKRTGNAIVEVLSKESKDKGVEFLMETRARKLVTDRKGIVTGVLAEQKGKELEIKAKSVIIATGSISGNKELVKKYFPGKSFDNVKIMADLPFCTGDGLLMAQEVGATEDTFISSLLIGPHTHPQKGEGADSIFDEPEAIRNVGTVIRRPNLMFVNKYGMRYANDGLFYLHNFGWLCGMALDRQPGRLCYVLMDDKILRDMLKEKKNYYDGGMAGGDDPLAWLDRVEDNIKSEARAGRAKISNSWDEIAKWMGADPAVLKASVDRYNVFCRNGYDADFLKPKEHLLPLTTPPYYAILGNQGVDTLIGGIRISHNMEVLDKELKPIKGLYAVGVATSGWLGQGYSFSGSELSFSVYSGYSAGKIATEYVKSTAK